MTLYEVYKDSLTKLQNPDTDEISVRILLCHNNGIKSMSGFYIHKNENVKDLPLFLEQFNRFLEGEPIQYILGETEFLGYDFYVDKRVLIPRQETEEVVTQAYLRALQYFGDSVINVADICCGSGVMGISLAKKLKVRYLFMSDISEDAIEVAKKNASRNDVIANFFVGDACEKLVEAGAKVDLLVANPPYILKKEDVDKSVLQHEPHLALFTDEELTVYKHIFEALPKIKNKKMLCVFEIGHDLKEKLTKLLEKTVKNATFGFVKDINGKERILILELR
jgi:release factor glutamine methyltransferase